MFRRLKCLSLVASGLSAVTSAGFLASPALAQDGAMTELYGYGVHRFYAGDYVEAQRVLNIVVDAGIEDPRPHFFRGLTQHQLGLVDAAKADFEHAADLEAHGRRAVNVDYALQRIQGPVRQEIEMVRMMARVALYQEMAAKGQLPPDQRGAPTVPIPPAAGGMLPPSLAPAPGIAPPQGGEVTPTPAVPGQMPAVPDSQINPFQDDQTPAPAPVPTVPPTDSTNPFDTGAAPAAPVVPAEPSAPAAPADPFNVPPATEPAPAAPAAPADPFSTPPATEPAPTAPAAPADPFGSTTEPAPAAPVPAEPAPAEPTPAEPTPAEPTPAEPTPAEPTPAEPANPPATPTDNPFGT